MRRRTMTAILTLAIVAASLGMLALASKDVQQTCTNYCLDDDPNDNVPGWRMVCYPTLNGCHCDIGGSC